MSPLFESVASMGAAALMLGVGGYSVLASLWRLRREPAPAELGAMLARHGIDWGRLAAAGALNEFSRAVGRCASCCTRAECRAWLQSGSVQGYAAFCPNAALVERLTR